MEYETRRVSLSLINVSDYHHQMAEHPVSRKTCHDEDNTASPRQEAARPLFEYSL